jgi:hypothetical protein
MPEQVIPRAENLEEILTSLHTQLYIMRSQVEAWQSSSFASDLRNVEDEKTEKAFSLMEQCCQMDWEIGQSLLALLQDARAVYAQKDSSSLNFMGTPSPMLNKSPLNAATRRHPSSVVTAASSSLTAN